MLGKRRGLLRGVSGSVGMRVQAFSKFWPLPHAAVDEGSYPPSSLGTG